ncbi:MAG TPA: beta-N-acetylhexosaminidase [Alphaproteobacteria bacterium]|nr:beta-N-acetylhexosaminidase [Alphaproteobacteria bacterium]USO05801.1 MAG: beta-N-acetylhexosaminidase [Rhodospirillales bacterium]HOO82194.1 beta-N-acetylhexosaminidase [Alphaproteobacteria bacterium]
MIKAVILSCAGAVLSGDERAFFKEAHPVGFILFVRNCESPGQVKALCDELRACVGWHCPILIDQEGGRVQRLKPPMWRQYPPMKSFGDKAREDMDGALEDLRFTILQLAEELVEVGVNVNCAPVLDVLQDDTHEAIGDRAFSNDGQVVGRLGLSVCRHLLAAGIMPVIKHIPGHGRGKVDSHKDLPHVAESLETLQKNDFDPFRIVVESDVGCRVWAMVAHIVYDQIDNERPASVSSDVIEKIIRQDIGFDGFLVSDDLDMEALGAYGPIAARAALTIEAGCDAALYCAGDLAVMEKIVKTVPNLSRKARKRLQNSLGRASMAA